MKKLLIVLAVAFLAMLSVNAYAEVQNVKVGGDITAAGVSRYAYDLGSNTGAEGKTDSSIIYSIVRVKLDADLTDNVVATVRLLNERVWGTLDETASNTDIDLDEAYVTLKEFAIPEATVMVGRLPLKLGDGLILGDPDTNRAANAAASGFPTGWRGFSARKAFDAIVGIYDNSPLKVTAGMAKGSEGDVQLTSDDVDIYVISADYDLGTKNTVLTGTYLLDDARKGNVNNYGLRITSMPIDHLKVKGEYIYQTTNGGTRTDGKVSSDNAIILGANYTLADNKMKPSFGVDYTRLSSSWNVLFEDMTPADIMNILLPNTNTQYVGADVSAKPMDDLTVKLRLVTAKAIDIMPAIGVWGQTTGNYAMTDKKQLGNEADLHFTYDYTEDVQFGLKMGFFKPGNAFAKSNNKSATQVLGSMKVTF